jgi:hypothetical protein
LSAKSRTGYLWIDQIVINQDDIDERSRQVALMGEIYRRCVRCLVWIDCDASIAGESDFTLAWASGVGETIRQLMRSFQLDDLHQPLLQSIARIARLTSTRAITDHMLWFLQHPWFTRTWVYQEFVLPHEVTFMIGDFELPGIELERVFQLGTPYSGIWFNVFHRMFINSAHRPTGLEDVPGMEFLLDACLMRTIAVQKRMCARLCAKRNTFVGYEQVNFINMLFTVADSKASDARDHAFALIGFAPFLLEHFTVDYYMPVEKVFASLLKAFIMSSNSLEFVAQLPSAAGLSRSRLQLPSWVPNWTVKHRLRFICAHDNQFCASGKHFGVPGVRDCAHYHASSTLWQSPKWNELRVAGKIIDEVQFVLQPMSIYQSVHFTSIDPENRTGRLPWEVSTLEAFLTNLHDLGHEAADELSKEALLRTLFMDGVQLAAMDALESGESPYREDIKVFGAPHHAKIKDIIDYLLHVQSTSDSSAEPSAIDFAQLPHYPSLQVLHELCKIQYARRVIFSKYGRFGLAPNLTEKGYAIAVLHGLRTPVILRERQNYFSGRGKESNSRQERVFNIIGECYLDGAMYGELADLDDEKADVFTLV